MCRYADMCHMEIIAPFSINVGGRKGEKGLEVRTDMPGDKSGL